MTDWTEKYRPSTLSEIRGNNSARDELREWAQNWPDDGTAVVVHGSPGVGKTSAAHALAADMDWAVIELNASNQRTASVIERVAGEAAKSGTLTEGSSGRKLIILDEADNLHGNVDRGGAAAITRLVKDAAQPVVLLANEFYEMSNGLRNACEEIEFRDVSKRSIVPVLRDLCRREDVAYEDDALEALAKKNSGDLRSAINDLQALATQTERLETDDVVTGERDRSTDIFEFLDQLIKEKDAQAARQASFDVDETPDDLINWIEDNVPKDFSGTELASAYDFLANADRWLGRVRASQNYSYWRYASDNMTAGVAASRQEQKGGWTRYGPPSYWSKLGRSRGKRNTRDHIARQIAESNGVSMGTARRDILPYLGEMTHHCSNRELTVAMTAAYDLEANHVAFVTGSGKDTNKVQDIVADAQERKADAALDNSQGAFDGVADLDERESETGLEEATDAAEDGPGDLETEPEPSDAAPSDSNPSEESESSENQSGLGDFT